MKLRNIIKRATRDLLLVVVLGVPIHQASADVRISEPLTSGQQVRSFEIAPDGGRIVYLSNHDPSGTFELYSVATGGGVTRRVHNTSLQSFATIRGYQFSPDSSRVIYAMDPAIRGQHELFSAPLSGIEDPISLSSGNSLARADSRLARVADDSSRVVYQVDGDVGGVFELYSVPIAGGDMAFATGSSIAVDGGLSIPRL